MSVEAWRDEVVVRARGLLSEGTVALEREFSDALERWNRQGADRDAVPRQPAERIFDLDVSVADGAGTAYSPTSSARGGGGTNTRIVHGERDDPARLATMPRPTGHLMLGQLKPMDRR